MDPDYLINLATSDLSPLLAADATVVPKVVKRRDLGGRDAPGNRAWIVMPGEQELQFVRSLKLSVWEGALMTPYGRALNQLADVPHNFASSAASDILLRAISEQVGGVHHRTVEAALRFIFKASLATYEGQRVHLNLLLDLSRSDEAPAIGSLSQLEDGPWFPMLGSGLDTGYLLDANGAVVCVEDVREPTKSSFNYNALRPDAFRHVGDWTLRKKRVAISLARSGEVLIHQGGELRYVHRSGSWRGFPTEPAIKQSWSKGSSMSQNLKKAVLASAIDASLAHHGASIAIVSKGSKHDFVQSEMLREVDIWPENVRSGLYGSHKFGDLTRRQRLEILSMDGATVLDHQGSIITAGAIVKVGAGSAGGGRLAATKALAEFGAALKVSQDGPIELFGKTNRKNLKVESKMKLA